MKRHQLKTWPAQFEAVDRGDKHFEFRKNDRDYQKGDQLVLEEYDSIKREYTGRSLLVDVTYIVYGPDFGIPGGYCVMSIKEVSPVAV